MKILDLGSGPWKYPGSISVDWNPKVNPDVLWDLNKFPYPFNDNEFDLVYCSHVLEHLNEPVKVIEEIWRILKLYGKLILIVSHFSSRGAYSNPEHKHYFSSLLFDYFERERMYFAKTEAKFKILKIKLIWTPPKPKCSREKQKKVQVLLNFINSILTPLANLSIDFCERVWCYWVGGMQEICFIVEAIK